MFMTEGFVSSNLINSMYDWLVALPNMDAWQREIVTGKYSSDIHTVVLEGGVSVATKCILSSDSPFASDHTGIRAIEGTTVSSWVGEIQYSLLKTNTRKGGNGHLDSDSKGASSEQLLSDTPSGEQPYSTRSFKDFLIEYESKQAELFTSAAKPGLGSGVVLNDGGNDSGTGGTAALTADKLRQLVMGTINEGSLQFLTPTFTPPATLKCLFDDTVLDQYAQIHHFLLTHKLATRCLQDLWKWLLEQEKVTLRTHEWKHRKKVEASSTSSSSTSSIPATKIRNSGSRLKRRVTRRVDTQLRWLHQFRHEAQNFLDILQGYIMSQVVEGSWVRLQSGVILH
jgi:hypothetical protein